MVIVKTIRNNVKIGAGVHRTDHYELHGSKSKRWQQSPGTLDLST